MRTVCAKLGGRQRECKSGRRDGRGKCVYVKSDAQKARARLLAKAGRMGKRAIKKRADSNKGIVFRKLRRSAQNTGEVVLGRLSSGTSRRHQG